MTGFRKHLDMRFLPSVEMTRPAQEEWEEGSGAQRPILPPKSAHGRCHFDQNTQRSEVLPGEIYSPMSLSHYDQNFWVKSQNDKGLRWIGGE